MNTLLPIFLLILGGAFLVAGYTAPQRVEDDIKRDDAAFSQAVEFKELNEATNKAVQASKQYLQSIDDVVAGRSLKVVVPPAEKMDPLIDEEITEHRQKDRDLRRDAAIMGTIQYCVGWLFIAAAVVTVALGPRKKPDPAV